MSKQSVHDRAVRDLYSRPDMLVIGLASILDGLWIIATLGGATPTLRQKASSRAARRMAGRQYWY